MQDLIVGAVYEGTLNNAIYRGEKGLFKYLGGSEVSDTAELFEVFERKNWDSGEIWEEGRNVDLSTTCWRFKMFNPCLENK